MNRHAIHGGDHSLFVDIKPGREVEFSIGDRSSGRFQRVTAAREDAADLAEWLTENTAVPADAPAHGSPLDYLAQAKRVIESGDLDAFCDGTGLSFSESPGAIRLLSMLQSAHLAILAERAKR